MNKNDKWEDIRIINKKIRKEETDTIKEFVLLAKSQGSKNPEWYYKHFSNIIINKLNIDKDIKRNELSEKDLDKISILEENIKSNIKLYMDNGYYYKDIYKEIKTIINNI